MTKNINLNRVLVAIVVFAVLITSVFTAQGASNTASAAEKTTKSKVTAQELPEGTRTQKSTSTDYIVANFDGINEGQNVIEPVTYERLRKDVLDQSGKSVIVLGSVNNVTTKKSLQYINAAARAKGIQKVYFFDPFIAGTRGVDIVPNVANPQNNQQAQIIAGTGTFPGLWSQLVDTATINLSGGSNPAPRYSNNPRSEYLHDINTNYSSDDTYLFVFDKGTETDKTAIDGPLGTNKGIITELLIENSNVDAYVANSGATITPAINTVFTDGGILTGADATNYDDWHFFQTAFTESPTVESFGIDDSSKFKIRSVTQPELVNILNTPGKHNVFISGSWCGDSRAVIASIAANAYRYDEIVYLYDFRVDGSYSGIANYAHTLRPEQPTTVLTRFENGTEYGPASYGYGFTGVGFLGNEIVELLYPFGSGDENFVQQYYPNGDSTKPLGTASQRNFRSPYLFQYEKGNNNDKGSVLKDWVHTVKEWEKPYRAASVYNWPITANTKLDYEISTGGDFTPAQIRAGVAAISEYFTGKPNVAHTAPGTISTTISADNGCGGSDDDPLDASGDTTLLPFNGTSDYDVTNYNLNVGYYRVGDVLSDGSTTATKDTFEGNAVITATAKKTINTISLDFRDADIDYANVNVEVNSANRAINRTTKTDNYGVDEHKINIELSSPISKNTEFAVTIPYTVGTVEDSLSATPGEPNGFTSRVDGKGFVATGEPLGSTYWFPNNNTPADGATYNISLSAPQNSAWRTISAGRRTANPSTSGGRTTSNWIIDTPTSPYQVFAAFGEYTELGSTTEKITLKDGTEIQSLSFVNSTLYNSNPGARDKADTYYSQLAKYIQDIEAIVGKYPGTSVGFVLDDLSNGHGESAEFGAIETKWRPYYTSAALNTPESTFVHEFTHQWYGNSVLLGQWSDLWLNEGFATYVTDLYYEKAGITSSANTRYTNVYNNTAASNEWWTYPSAGVESEPDLWGGAAAPYRKAGLALSVLRTSIGDAKFLQILNDWATQKAEVPTTTADFITFAQAIAGSGYDLTAWANTWLYGKTKPATLTLTGVPANNIVDPSNITIVLDGGSNVTLPVIRAGEAIGTLPAPTKAGFKFDGWYVGDVKIDATWIVPSTPFTLVAKWVKEEVGGGDLTGGDKQQSGTDTIAQATIKTTVDKVTLSGTSAEPKFTVTVGGTVLVEGTDYTVTYKNNTKVGKATATITGIGKYAGTQQTITYKILPKNVTVKSLKAGAKKFTLKWKKVTGASNYQVRYKLSTSKKWKTVSVTAKSTSKVIKKLKKGKKYQVQIRAYTNVKDGAKKVKYYSPAWSKVKTIKVKK